jgi:formylglycine-generating enzyme required for sulfatase activity
MSGVAPTNASDVRTYDEGGSGNQGLSAHNAAEMSGNVLEWQFTVSYTGSHNSIYSGESQSGYGISSNRVLRGGHFNYDANGVRAASRYANTPSSRITTIGFRAAKTQ